MVALLDEPTRRLGKDEEETGEDESESELNTDGDTPCTGVLAVLSTIRSKGSAKKTDSDSPLVTGNNGTTDPARSSLRLVHGNNGGENTDTETSNDTTTDEDTKISGGHLHDDTNAEDEESNLHTPSSTEDIRDGSTGESTDEGTSGENRDNERGVAGAQVVTRLLGTIGVGGDVDGVELTEGLLEVLHDKETRDGTSVVTEEDTTESRSGGDEDSRERLLNRSRLNDSRGIAGVDRGNSTTSHFDSC